MSLITCPECQKQISEYALSCPNCGFQLTQEIVSKQKNENKKPRFHESYDEDIHENGSFHDSFELSSPQKKMTMQSVEQKRKNQSVLIALGIVIVVFIYFATTDSPPSQLDEVKTTISLDSDDQNAIVIKEFIREHSEYGEIIRTNEMPNWENGIRKEVMTNTGNYLFYLNANEVVGVWRYEKDGSRTQLFKTK